MNRKIAAAGLALTLTLSLAACSSSAEGPVSPAPSTTPVPSQTVTAADAVHIVLSDAGTTVDGAAIPTDPAESVYIGADIVYYEAGHDESYGAGSEDEAHSPEGAAAQTVVTITQPGVYRLSGTLSAGQVAVDLGEDAAEDPGAVVTLILNGVDITCTLAPAVIFYRVYECGSADAESASPTVDTSAAGANVVIADGSENNITGSHVAKIYKEGTDKKLHKYDGAFYSKMSMNISGEAAQTGVLNITADNEGLDTELHLTINSGVINITADNDGINTNEDGVSVTTINGGTLNISAGLGAEGDGIDSNGYLVINGGAVVTQANPQTGDGGIDSDMGIYLNGGTVLALGSRNDAADADSAQPCLQLSFSDRVYPGSGISIQAPDGTELLAYTARQDYSSLTFSSPDLMLDTTYSVYVDGVRQQFTGHTFGMGGGMMGGGQAHDGMTPPEDGTFPEGMEPPTDGQWPERPEVGGFQGEKPEGEAPTGVRRGGRGPDQDGETLEPSTQFTLTTENNCFSGISGAS